MFDVLKASKGMAWSVSNQQLFHAARLFRATEGIDVDPAAAVAVGALAQAVASHHVKEEERILLNITGGGCDIRYSGDPVYQATPNVIVRKDELPVLLKRIGSPEKLANPKAYLKETAN
jgi:cysteate synthase